MIFLSLVFVSFCLIRVIIRLLIRYAHTLNRMTYTLVSSNAPSEKKVPSAYMVGENRLELSLILYPHINAVAKMPIKMMLTAIYAFIVRCRTRNSTAAAVRNRSANHLSKESLREVTRVDEPYATLKSGFPSMTTGDPSL